MESRKRNHHIRCTVPVHHSHPWTKPLPGSNHCTRDIPSIATALIRSAGCHSTTLILLSSPPCCCCPKSHQPGRTFLAPPIRIRPAVSRRCCQFREAWITDTLFPTRPLAFGTASGNATTRRTRTTRVTRRTTTWHDHHPARPPSVVHAPCRVSASWLWNGFLTE